MADYAIGDLQGCFTPLQSLLDIVDFNPSRDHLYCVGDIVARGPDSLACLNFLAKHAHSVTITLGNHDLHFLACIETGRSPNPKDKLDLLFNYAKRSELVSFLKSQPLACFHEPTNTFISHAGIYPTWSKAQALDFAQFAEQCYRGVDSKRFFETMYGPATLEDFSAEDKFAKFRAIVNVFTRMRFLEPSGELDFKLKEGLNAGSPGFIPWFEHPALSAFPHNIVFGHWAALEGQTGKNRVYALDTGYVWGGAMSLLNLHTKEIVKVSATI
jgi:bis(5'-nucleosyl)-tetraphosphatase (symmetrical)